MAIFESNVSFSTLAGARPPLEILSSPRLPASRTTREACPPGMTDEKDGLAVDTQWRIRRNQWGPVDTGRV